MYNLLKINSALIQAIEYKVILLDNDYIHIGNYRFKKNIITNNGDFIGTKYKKFLGLGFDTYEYESYKYAITKLYSIGFYDGNSRQDSNDIRRILQDAMDTGIFLVEANKLFGLLKKAIENIEEQNQILINLEKEVF